MLIKIACSVAVCICSWLLGVGYKNMLNENILIIEDYIKFAKALKSTVIYSGKNMFDFIKSNKSERLNSFSDYVTSNKNNGMEKILKEFKTSNIIEAECVKILHTALVFAESSSDASGIAEQLEEAINFLEQYKNETREVYCGKIKTAPSLAMIMGLFIAVLFI